MFKNFIRDIDKKLNQLFFPRNDPSKFGLRFIVIGLAIGFIFRLSMLWLVEYNFLGDAGWYINASKMILQNQNIGYFRPPMYPIFLALIEWSMGVNKLNIQIIQMIFNLISVLLITRISAVLYPKSSKWVFIFMLLSPFEAVYAGAFLSETITSFFLIIGSFCIITLKNFKRFVLGGISLGFCVLTRDVYLLMIPFITVILIIISQNYINFNIKNALIFIIGACAIIAPWTYRNYVMTDNIIITSKGRLGIELWLGTWAVNGKWGENYLPEAFNNEEEKYTIGKMPFIYEESLFQEKSDYINEMDKIFMSIALNKIYENPVKVLKTYILRVPNLWMGTRFDIFLLNKQWFEPNTRYWYILKSIFWGLNFILIILCLIGLIISLYENKKLLILFIPLIYTAVICFPLPSFENRYSQPVYPFIIFYVGITIVNFSRIWIKTNQLIKKVF